MWMANRLSCVAAVAVLTTSGACIAQERMGYSGVAIGQSETTFDSGASSGSGVARNKSGGLFFGYDVTPYWGIFAATWWLASQDQPGITIDNVVYSQVTRNVNGWSLEGTVTWPVAEKLKLTGRAGVFVWKAETYASSSLFNSRTLSNESGVSPTYGIGARFDLGQSWGLRMDYDAFENIDQSRIQMLTVGAYYRF
jgi:hypothetical protein